MDLLDKKYICLNQRVENRYQAIHLAAAPLLADGKIRETFMDAVCMREIEYPTGLDTPIGVAIPHTDAFHVVEDAISMVTLANPVSFHLMGTPEETVDVSIVFLLAIRNSSRQTEVLGQLINLIRDTERLEQILELSDVDEVYRLIQIIKDEMIKTKK